MAEESREQIWPSLDYAAWRETCATLQLWTQIAGKIRLALGPWINHSWGVTLYVTSRGLSTSLIPYGARAFEIEFDFIRHQLRITTAEGEERAIKLQPQSVASFYREVMNKLREVGIEVQIGMNPNETLEAIPFDHDEKHAAYDPEYANRFWRVLLQADRVFKEFRSRFCGKCSPVHFFWGSFDLAVTRFSGRRAPPREGPLFMRDAYSHEVISHGFWPGNAMLPGPVFYAYAVPEPAGLKEARIRPDGAYYHRELGEFILPYERVRTAPSPDQAILDFVDSTYDAAATLAHWDRAALERSATG